MRCPLPEILRSPGAQSGSHRTTTQEAVADAALRSRKPRRSVGDVPRCGGPSLRSLPPCEPHEKAALVRYLTQSPTVIVAPMRLTDPLDPGVGDVIPVEVNTDGEGCWYSWWGYLEDRHDVGLPEEFMAHARARDFVVAEMSTEELMSLVD